MPDMHDAHHLMILMGEDVAVPDVAARFVKGSLNPRDLTWQRRDHVLGSIFDIPGRLWNVGTIGNW